MNCDHGLIWFNLLYFFLISLIVYITKMSKKIEKKKLKKKIEKKKKNLIVKINRLFKPTEINVHFFGYFWHLEKNKYSNGIVICYYKYLMWFFFECLHYELSRYVENETVFKEYIKIWSIAQKMKHGSTKTNECESYLGQRSEQ